MSEGKHKEQGLKNELKQSAESIKTKLRRAEEDRQRKAAGRSPLIVGTVFAVILLTMVFFAIIFSIYINRTMKNKVEVNLSAYDMSLATEMYAKDSSTGEWSMYGTLYDGENRILLTADQIPDNLRKAAVAIEDKRFYKHSGVDWPGGVQHRHGRRRAGWLYHHPAADQEHHRQQRDHRQAQGDGDIPGAAAGEKVRQG